MRHEYRPQLELERCEFRLEAFDLGPRFGGELRFVKGNELARLRELEFTLVETVGERNDSAESLVFPA